MNENAPRIQQHFAEFILNTPITTELHDNLDIILINSKPYCIGFLTFRLWATLVSKEKDATMDVDHLVNNLDMTPIAAEAVCSIILCESLNERINGIVFSNYVLSHYTKEQLQRLFLVLFSKNACEIEDHEIEESEVKHGCFVVILQLLRQSCANCWRRIDRSRLCNRVTLAEV